MIWEALIAIMMFTGLWALMKLIILIRRIDKEITELVEELK